MNELQSGVTRPDNIAPIMAVLIIALLTFHFSGDDGEVIAGSTHAISAAARSLSALREFPAVLVRFPCFIPDAIAPLPRAWAGEIRRFGYD